MKKFISILLIVAMMMTTMTVVFCGTISAFAAEKSSVIAEVEKYEVVSELVAKLWEIIKDFFISIWDNFTQQGIIATLMDGFYELLELCGINVDGFYEWELTSGIIDWIAETFFGA